MIPDAAFVVVLLSPVLAVSSMDFPQHMSFAVVASQSLDPHYDHLGCCIPPAASGEVTILFSGYLHAIQGWIAIKMHMD
jgi:hypothetical protein